MAKEPEKDKNRYNYTPDGFYKVRLRGKPISKDMISLYLIYYLGTTYDKNGKCIGIRQYEFLNIYINENPKKGEETKNTKTQIKRALDIRQNRELDLQSNTDGLINLNKKKINFLDYYQYFLNNYKNKDIRLVRYSLEHFKKFIGKEFVLLNEVDEALVKDFKRYLLDNLNGETPSNYFTKFKKLCKLATKEKLFEINPADEITVNRPGGVRKEILSFNEIEKLVKAACGNHEIKQAFLFCLNTGLRHVDVKSLRWNHIDLEAGQIRKSQSKIKTSSNPFVYIDLNTNAKVILSQQKKGNHTDLVFTLPTVEACSKTLKNWVKRAGILKNITWHSARHSFATNLLMNNANIKTVSSLLGHSGLKHTEKYTHLVDELKKKAVDSLPDMNF